MTPHNYHLSKVQRVPIADLAAGNKIQHKAHPNYAQVEVVQLQIPIRIDQSVPDTDSATIKFATI